MTDRVRGGTRSVSSTQSALSTAKPACTTKTRLRPPELNSSGPLNVAKRIPTKMLALPTEIAVACSFAGKCNETIFVSAFNTSGCPIAIMPCAANCSPKLPGSIRRNKPPMAVTVAPAPSAQENLESRNLPVGSAKMMYTN